jgi:hypothetical protein
MLGDNMGKFDAGIDAQSCRLVRLTAVQRKRYSLET